MAADAASRSSAAYVRILLQRFHGNRAAFHEQPADLRAMLQTSDAALLIGDPALCAHERVTPPASMPTVPGSMSPRGGVGTPALPWVAAVWAVRPEALGRCGIAREELIADLLASRDAGLQHVDDLVAEWQPRLALPENIIRHYLSAQHPLHAGEACLAAMERFYHLAEACAVLPGYQLRML